MKIILVLLTFTNAAMAQELPPPSVQRQHNLTQMTPLGDGSDLDKAVVICNAHVHYEFGNKYDSGFEGCYAVLEQWRETKAGIDAAAKATKAAEDAEFIKRMVK